MGADPGLDTPERERTGGRGLRLAIVGIGLIGGSVGLAARQRGTTSSVVAVDTDPSALREAVALGAADDATGELVAGVRDADLVILSVPVPRILEMLPRIAETVRPDAIVTDVGSVKAPVAALGERLLGPRFVPGHPMAGSERHGVGAGRADLFQGATWVITSRGRTARPETTTVADFAASLGAVPLLLTAEEHDRSVALTSHLPHVLAYAQYALARQQGPDSPVWKLAAGGFHSATRVAASSPEMWSGICLANRAAVREQLAALVELLSAMDASLEAGDAERLTEQLHAGHRTNPSV